MEFSPIPFRQSPPAQAEELKRPGSTWSYDVDRYALRAVLEGTFRREAVWDAQYGDGMGNLAICLIEIDRDPRNWIWTGRVSLFLLFWRNLLHLLVFRVAAASRWAEAYADEHRTAVGISGAVFCADFLVSLRCTWVSNWKIIKSYLYTWSCNGF